MRSNDRERFDPERILTVLRTGQREWPDLQRVIGRARRRDWNQEVAAAAERFAFLQRWTPFEPSLLEDARTQRLREQLDSELRRLAPRTSS